MKTKKTIMIFAVSALISGAYAELAPETAIEDYLPTINIGAMETGMGGGQWSWDYQGMTNDYDLNGTTWTLNNDLTWSGMGGMVTIEECVVDPDPLVTLKQLVVNNTATPVTYVLTVDQPAYLPTSSSSVRGSVVVTLLDKDSTYPFDGSSFTDNGTPVYKAYIDDNEVNTLMDPAYSLTTASPATTINDSEEFGWDSYSAGVVSNIAIQVEFTLSAGDSATVLSRFEVIPEPASLVLIGMASSAILFVRRKFFI